MSYQWVKTGVALAIGLIGGAILYHVAILTSGATIVGPREISEQRSLIEALQQENRLQASGAFDSRSSLGSQSGGLDPPYDIHADARAEVAAARATAAEDGKFLMVTFGANWCVDCRTLHRSLRSSDVAEYASERFMFVNVNVGEFNRNHDIAAELGVTLERGIPVAILYDQLGEVIGTTNGGELEPARLYTSKQILKFLRDVAERATIRAPDSVR